MHHIYPKGDQLCPLGFHPQVRWPTRCKRCFRDYKEHGNKRNGDDIASSSPSLSISSNSRENKEETIKPPPRSWTSSTNLSSVANSSDTNSSNNSSVTITSFAKRPSSWTSTPDLDEKPENGKSDVSVSISLPKRRHTASLDLTNLNDDAPTPTSSITIKRPPLPPKESKKIEAPPSPNKEDPVVIYKTDSLAERVRKMQLLKKQSSVEREIPAKEEKPVPKPRVQHEERKRLEAQPPALPEKKKDANATASNKRDFKIIQKSQTHDLSSNSQDVQFLIHVKNSANQPKVNEDSSSFSSCTDTTDTTIVDSNDPELLEQIESLKRELDNVKTRCERAERDKSDILLRRLASMDTSSNRTAASEALKLQQKVNELKQQVEELTDDNRSLNYKVKELESDLTSRPEKNIEEELRSKLQAAETLCEELMDENEDMKRELRNMESEIDEMQDSFREDQADEYTGMKKELEQTTKNCRILSFKLKKSERKIEQLESEKQTVGSQANSDLLGKIKVLEEELKAAHEVSRKLQTEAEQQASTKRRAPTLGTIGKSMSGDGKYSRESLTRGGSQDDPVKLMRDLQDSMEREADLREQLKFAEEEAENLRKKSSRVDDENESLMMQLKKMASKTRSRKLSPTAPINRLSPAVVEKDEGISDEEDPAELRVLLELNEQEASVLRRKVEELEKVNTTQKSQIDELQEKIKTDEKSGSKKLSFLSKSSTPAADTKKLKQLEDEIKDLKKKMSDKDKLVEKLQSADKTKKITKSNSLEMDEKNLDFKRQLQTVEQEAAVLRTKVITLEQENEKIGTENKKLSLQAARNANKKLDNSEANQELVKTREALDKLEKDKVDLEEKLKRVLNEANEKLPARVPKKYSESNTKLQFKNMIEELENEITEMRAIVVRSGGSKMKDIEKELKDAKEKLASANSELKLLKSKTDNAATKTAKLKETEIKLKKTETENDKLNESIKQLEDRISKQDGVIKKLENEKSSYESQAKSDKEAKTKLEKDLDKEKKDKTKVESKLSELESELQTAKKNADKTKSTLEKEIASLKSISSSKRDEPSSATIKKQNDKITELEANMKKETKKYSDLTGKYEILEEEHVLTKAQLTTEKEKLNSEITSLTTKLNQTMSEESKLKHENQEMSKKLTDTQDKFSHLEKEHQKINKSVEHEKTRYKNLIEVKENEIQRLNKENGMNLDLIFQMRKDNDEIRKKLDDFEKVNKVQRTLNDHNNSLEQELKKMQVKLDHAEHAVKAEVAATRLRYEQQITNLQTEITSIQRQCERFKRDRDTYKQLLEAAQKSMADLKSGRTSRSSNTSGDEDEKSKIITLEQQLGCLEDELSEARLESSKLKTELVSEKSASEIKISEMKSKLNEYEEERLIGSGRSGIPGMKTRLELSWQKEREELTRLLQETSTLARDLRQTLFEVERERDKDKLESRRKQDQLKKANEEEMEEGRRKISELQCDLLELRDAHAKLRTANEKLRRERERFERERDSATKRRLEQDGERKVGALLQTVEEIVKIAPELQMATTANNINTGSNTLPNQRSLTTPNPPRRSKSPSPGGLPQNLQITGVLSRLAEAYEELRKYQKFNEDEKERERYRRGGMRRAASTENDDGNTSTRPRLARNTNGSLYRKSLSLDQSIHQDQLIWKQDEGSMSSIQSIDSEFSGYAGMGRESSMDSRLSAGSTQSDMPRGPRKKKRGIMGKLRSLTKGRGSESDGGGSQRGSDSDLSIAGDHRSSKKDLKERLSGMFRRSGTQSRGNSTENLDTSKRPVAVTVNTIENGPRPSPAPSTPSTPHLRKSSKPPTPVTVSLTPSSKRKAK